MDRGTPGAGGRRSALVSLLLTLMATTAPLTGQDPEPPGGAPAGAPADVTGTVVDAVTGAPLAAVWVGTGDRWAETDGAGRFVLSGVVPEAVTRVVRIGYRPVRMAAVDLPAVLRLEPEPVLLRTLGVRTAAPGLLARGTALSVGTVEGGHAHQGGHTTVAEILDEAEGVSVSRVGSWGSRPVLRGLTGERVAILIDGNRVHRACAFGMDQGLAAIDPATVERIEVVAGPGTALYGSGNIGGVINVVTSARPEVSAPVSGEVRARGITGAPGGSVGVSVGAETGAIDLSASLDATRHGDYRTPDRVVDGSGFRQATADISVGWVPVPGRDVALHGQAYEARDIGWPSMPGAAIPRESRRAASLDYGHQLGAGWLDGVAGRVFIQRLDHEMGVVMEMGGAMPMTSTTTQRSHSTTGGARAQARLVPHAAVHLDVGVEATEWAAEATRTTERSGGTTSSSLSLHTWPAVSLLDAGVFGQGQLLLGRGVAVSGGARIDRVSREADGWPSSDEWVRSGNAGLTAEPIGGVVARAGVGYGYRTPDPTELFGLALKPDGFVYRGNPELDTETSRTVELALAYEGEALAASLTVYRNDLDGLIAPVPAPGDSVGGRPVRGWANLDEGRLSGVTGSFRWSPGPRLRVRGEGAYTRGEDGRTGLPLPSTPPLEGSFVVRVVPIPGEDPSRALWVESRARGAAAQDRNAAAVGEPETPAWLVVDIRSGWRMAGVALVVGVDNVLDEAYRGHLDPVGLLRPGRSAHVGATLQFGGAR